MKRSILLSLSILFAITTFSQSTATDFSVTDCDGTFHNLFTELDEGKVIVIAWVMPCAGCIGPSLEAYTVAQSFESTHPGQVLYYMVDDYANTTCSTLNSWANNNSMGEADAYFSNADIDMLDYGTPGMPKIVVVGCSGHAVYYNKNYTAAGIGDAINEALTDCNTISAIEENENNIHELSVFPNPVNNTATISYEITEASIVTVDVLNLMGESVLIVSNSNQNAGLIEFQFDTNSLKDGFYLVRIHSNKGEKVTKFSVKH